MIALAGSSRRTEASIESIVKEPVKFGDGHRMCAKEAHKEKVL